MIRILIIDDNNNLGDCSHDDVDVALGSYAPCDVEHYAARLDWSSYAPCDGSPAAVQFALSSKHQCDFEHYVAQFDWSSYSAKDVSLAAAQFRWYSYFALI